MKRLADSASAPADRALADAGFSERLIAWQKQHGRHRLPWQQTRDAYRIWLSEIMLQQTQVATVIPYYQRFLQRFPNVAALAQAPVEEVMALWAGLGYYTRARNLHRCAQAVVERHGGQFPADVELLADLPGIGLSTAAAIAAFAYGARAAILDGNVKRVFCRVFGIEGFPGQTAVERQLWLRADALLPQQDIEAYTQGLMDLGATVCTRSKPRCGDCPMQDRCVALASGRTAELPARKPPKATPEKATVMLLVLHDGEVLLEQRPPMGIWGGLLSLPEMDRLGADPVSDHLSAGVGRALLPFGEAQAIEALPAFVHAFTHYRLRVTPLFVRMATRADVVAQRAYAWWPLGAAVDAGLPAPVKKLVEWATMVERG